MNPERITGRTFTRVRAQALWLGGILLLAGCGTETRVTNGPSTDLSPSPGVTERNDRGKRLPAPEATEIAFDAETQTLRLYDLPAPARWMVQLPHDRTAVPVDREYKLPDGVDADKTLVYYAQPGGRQSKAVSLAQIQRAHESFTSRGP